MTQGTEWTVRRSAAWIAAAILVVVAAYYALRPSAVPVDLDEVTRGPLTVTIGEEGKSRIKNLFVVSAPIAGRVRRSPLEVGDAVERNKTTLTAIEPSPPPFLDFRSQSELQARIKAADAAVDFARAEVAKMKAELAFTEKELERKTVLSAREVVAESSLDRARMEMEIARAALAKSEAALLLREKEYESVSALAIGPTSPRVDPYGRSCCVTVTSPVSGRVLVIHKKSEQVVAQGTPLIEIGDPSDLEIVVEILSADAVRVGAGATATVTAWGGAHELAATVTRIEPAGFTKVSALGIEEQRVRVLLQFENSNTDKLLQRLGHDYRVFVRIVVTKIDDAVLVPLGALFRIENRWATYVAENGEARLRIIEIGHRNQQMAEVTNGLAAGEFIILHPGDRIADGVRISERRALN